MVYMTITSRLFEAYLKCPTKCFLWSRGETGTSNSYADWAQVLNISYRSEGISRLKDGVASNECVAGPFEGKDLKAAKWRLAVNSKAYAENLESAIDAVERVPGDTPGKPPQFVPIRFIFTNKLNRHDKLLLAFDALVLTEALGREVDSGNIIHGDTFATLRVKTSAMESEVRKTTAEIATLLAGQVPDPVLNRHCPECEFRDRCKQKAVATDDLSLLAGITEDERTRYRSKGIFTVTQLSYTFRPRRTPKRAKNPGRLRYPALQALAIRENTVYINGNARLPDSKAQVYLDIEGLPDSDSYYLISALVVCEGQETFHTFWADQKSDEPTMFAQFAEAICKLPDFRVLHFGGYEAVALKRMKATVPECLHPNIDMILDRATNVLSAIHPHVYFPTYSNGLKEIGRFLGFGRADEDATGLHSIVWRKSWDDNHDPDIKARLVQYNQDDCRELRHISDFIRGLASPDSGTAPGPQTAFQITRTEELATDRPRWELFRPKEYASEDLKKIVKCGYFDYQRERVFVRTHPQFKTVNKNHRKFRRTLIRVNKLHRRAARICPRCRSKHITKGNPITHDLFDLRFSRSGAKKWITRFVSWKYFCSTCDHQFSSKNISPYPQKYGHGLLSWCVYSNVSCALNMSRVGKALGDVFGIFINEDGLYRLKRNVVDLYQTLYAEILESILTDLVIHIDETTVRLRHQKGYVWVMTSMDKVYYFYKPSREGAFLKDMLGKFSGVLVSDFYTAYDSLKCEQQKCLVHLVRDIDDDLLKHPLDMELKGMAQQLGTVLRAIIETVDRRGLQSRYLHKHKQAVGRFLESVASNELSSPVAGRYRKRFQKSGKKMFTFLDHEGVPWNNNNAEHAIKRFANYRRDADGRFTERTLQEYLVLATVFETCEFNNVNVLEFLLSQETTLEGLLRMAGRKSLHLKS
ncbi:MAG: IS66 family transposase [Acidobacteria bacterium]|nr:MAG: IS66 family transposase [Acidobacteriota bacterium]